MSDKCDRAVTCVFCLDLHLILLCSGLLQNDMSIIIRFWETAPPTPPISQH